MKGIICIGSIAVIFAIACGDVFATIDINLFKPGDEVQSNRLALAGDSAHIDPKTMDTDIKRISNGMNETNKFLSMKMMRTKKEACEDKISEKRCQKMKNQCKTEKVARVCKKTCGYCQDDCYHTLENLHCLSGCPTPVFGSDPANYHYILGRCYYFETRSKSFTEAEENCEIIFGTPGGRLFEPRNTVVNDEVANKAEATIPDNAWWIGIRTDPDPAPRHFYWLSGGPFTSLSFGNFAPGEPNDAKGEDCVELRNTGVNINNGMWNDFDCFDAQLSICEQGHEVIW